MNPVDFEDSGAFYLGGDKPGGSPTLLDSRDLTTHGVCVGMTGSGKTGLGVILLEEAALDGIPAIVIDPKGDMGNLLLSFPDLQPESFREWASADTARQKGVTTEQYAQDTATLWKNGLASWGQDGERIGRMRDRVEMSLYTPGSTAGRPLSLLQSFAAPGPDVLDDIDLFGDLLTSTTAGLLALIGDHGAPLQNPGHILISNILQRAWTNGEDLTFVDLIRAVLDPPFSSIGVLDVESFIPARERNGLATALNALLAAPGFAAWTQGDPMRIDDLLYTPEGKPKLSVLYIAHLGEKERMFFVTRFYNDLLAWTRRQSGTSSLRALIYMDEVFGYLPPVAQPPSKRPIMTLLKQARAYGVGMLLATQNPADLDYKALSNAGTWMIGRLQTERDRARLLDGMGLESSEASLRRQLDDTIAGLASREFVLHSVHNDQPETFSTRWAMSWLRGPLTRAEVRRLAQLPDASDSTGGGSGDRERPTEPRARPTENAIRTSTGNGTNEARPIVPDGISERFLPINTAPPVGCDKVVYRPLLYAGARVDFTKHNTSRRADFVVDAGDINPEIRWKNASLVSFAPEDLAEASNSTAGVVSFDEPSRLLFDEDTFDDAEKSLEDWLYRNEKLETFYHRGLRLSSENGESRASFARRVAEASREARDREIDELEDTFRKRMDRVNDRLELAEQRAREQAADVRDASAGAAMDIGSTLLGMFVGRRRSARSSLRSASRVRRERDQAERAQLKVHQLNEDLAELDSDFRGELEQVEQKYRGRLDDVETSLNSPLKRDCIVELTALLWVPYWEDDQRVRAWQPSR